MIEQRVQSRSLKGWRGPAVILATGLAVVLGSNVFYRLGRVIGNAASMLFIAYGCLIAWLLLNRYVLSFVYTCAGGCLRVCRAYGRRERLMLDVRLDDIRACGDLGTMRARFPDARVRRAVRRECPLEPLAVVHTDDGRPAILLLQPDAPLRDAIRRAVRR